MASRYQACHCPALSPATNKMLERHGSKANRIRTVPGAKFFQVLETRTGDRVHQGTPEPRPSSCKCVQRLRDPVTRLVVESIDPVEDFVHDVDAPLVIAHDLEFSNS